MKIDEYEQELKNLYGKALKTDDISLALKILERGREIGLEDIVEDIGKEKKSLIHTRTKRKKK